MSEDEQQALMKNHLERLVQHTHQMSAHVSFYRAPPLRLAVGDVIVSTIAAPP